MSEPVRVQVRCFAPTPKLSRGGVRCFARVVIYGTISVDGLAVRQTERGEYIVTWPQRRRPTTGRLYAIVELLDAETRSTVEHAVLVQAAIDGWIKLSPKRHGSVP